MPASRGWRSATVACSRVDCLLTTTSKATRAAPNTHGWEVIAIRQTDSPKAEPGQRVGAPAPLGSPLQQRHRPDHRRCRVHERKRIGRDTVCAGEMCSVGPEPGLRHEEAQQQPCAVGMNPEPQRDAGCQHDDDRPTPGNRVMPSAGEANVPTRIPTLQVAEIQSDEATSNRPPRTAPATSKGMTWNGTWAAADATRAPITFARSLEASTVVRGVFM